MAKSLENSKKQNSPKKIHKSPSLIKKRCEKIFNGIKTPTNQEAWDNFPEATKQELLESLKMKDNINLYQIDLTKIGEFVPTSKGDRSQFKEGTVQEDSIGSYFMINGMKCRKRQPGISGFAYENIQDRYNPFQRLKIGFYDKGKTEKFVIIDISCKPESPNMPEDIIEKLGGPLFIKHDKSTMDGPLSNISLDDISQYPSEENGYTLNIKGTTFQKFQPGITGFVYQSYNSGIEPYRENIFLAECKDGKMVGEGLILTREGKIYITVAEKQL